MQNYRCGIALLCGLAACAGNSASQGEDASVSATDRPHRHDAGVHVDARRFFDAPAADAPISTSSDASVSTGGGSVSCYLQANPSQTCSAPDHCCFDGYGPQHNGGCTTSTCAFGTITCDGPEDCATGQTCCAHAITDPDEGTTGYILACQATSGTGGCGAPPLNQQLCHPGATTCPSGQTCVTTYQYDNDLPRTLHVCR